MTDIGIIGKIIITNKLKKQIDYYHRENPGKEWSGTLFYKHTNGKIEDLKDLEFTATDIYLMDMGSEGYTAFKNSGEIVKAFDVIGDEELESLTGLAHSHHNMTAYYSTTDIKELEDNAESYFFFISLVVNTADKYVCKIVFPTTTKTVSEYLVRDAYGNLKNVKKESSKKELLSGDLSIEFETMDSVEEWVIKRTKEVKEKVKTPANAVTAFNRAWDNWDSRLGSYASSYSKTVAPIKSTPVSTTPVYSKFTSRVHSPEDDTVSFAKSILLIENKVFKSLNACIEDLELLDEEELDGYFIGLSNEIYDLFEEVHSLPLSMFDAKIEEVVKLLEDLVKEDNINLVKLIEFLKSIDNEV